MSTTLKFAVDAVEHKYAPDGALLAVYQPGVPYPVEGNQGFVTTLIDGGRARYLPSGCIVGSRCIFGETSMTANAANRVKDAVERVVDKIEKAADATATRLNGLSEKALDKFHQVERSVADPLEDALKGLDDLLAGTNGPPPLDPAE